MRFSDGVLFTTGGENQKTIISCPNHPAKTVDWKNIATFCIWSIRILCASIRIKLRECLDDK